MEVGKKEVKGGHKRKKRYSSLYQVPGIWGHKKPKESALILSLGPLVKFLI